MDSLKALCYGTVMALMINSSLRRREQLLNILPGSMAAEAKLALIRQNANKRGWRKQHHKKGLVDHCFRKVIQMFAEKDDDETAKFLKPLRLNSPSEHRLYYLIMTYHDIFKWRTRMADSSAPHFKDIIRGQFHCSTCTPDLSIPDMMSVWQGPY
jgi:hypothetical protein